jgi:hypothetical protein
MVTVSVGRWLGSGADSSGKMSGILCQAGDLVWGQ